MKTSKNKGDNIRKSQNAFQKEIRERKHRHINYAKSYYESQTYYERFERTDDNPQHVFVVDWQKPE